uniref:Uncharacterized protein n=1 Tax=viral metagenome TaxID=1070528 RepID=A0A6C0LD92_9ZZZZ
MSIFCSILHKLYDLEIPLPENQDYFSYYRMTQQTIPNKQTYDLYQFIVNFYIKTNHFTKSKKQIQSIKWKHLKDNLDNIFFPKKRKDNLLEAFSKTQKIMFALSKFVHIYKMKKTVIKIQTDLMLNEIDVRKKNVFLLLQDGIKYAFVISDLTHVIDSSLSHCCYFFAEPQEIKNPYNNIPFNKTILYNLYFFIRTNLFTMPILFELFFQCDFDLHTFKINNEHSIREVFIKNYVSYSHHYDLYPHITSMINKYYIDIDPDFPKETLVNIMRPYLHLYFLGKYLIFGCEKKYIVTRLLRKKLLQFSKYNPDFGKKIITPYPIFDSSIHPFLFEALKYTYVVTFNTDHITFNDDTVPISEIEINYEDNYDSMEDD